jgi:hypothetical protein
MKSENNLKSISSGEEKSTAMMKMERQSSGEAAGCCIARELRGGDTTGRRNRSHQCRHAVAARYNCRPVGVVNPSGVRSWELQ